MNEQSTTDLNLSYIKINDHPHLTLSIPLKDHDAFGDQQNQGLFCKMMACIHLGWCSYLKF